MSTLQSLVEAFVARFGTKPAVYRAPGRVNLIGEHTDYNDGFVMPAAIGFYCCVAASTRTDRKLVISSQEFPGDVELDLSAVAIQPSRAWSDYSAGVAVELRKAGVRVPGANLLIHGEVPIGAGLSSSAAVEVATALALAELSGAELNRTQLARICQQAENNFVGMRCGIMDQFASLQARQNHALMLDCRSLKFELLSVPESAKMVICDTGVKHKLAGGEYNLRRADCEVAVRALQKELREIRALRDVSISELEQHRGLLTEVQWKRARHIVMENARVQDAAQDLREGNLHRFGARMAESHRSLRDDYEVSCAELDLMVDLANQQQGVYGARMTGGGFGGATINLVDAPLVEKFVAKMHSGYQEKTGIVPRIHVCAPVEGAERVATAELAGWP